MKCTDLVSGLFWLIIGLLLSFWSLTYQIGSFIQPGPGFLPLGLGLLLIFLSCILLLVHEKKVSPIGQKGLSSLFSGWRRLVYTVLVLLVTIFLFEQIGSLFTVFLLVFFSMLVTEPRNWRTSLIVALLSALGIYMVFILLLKQELPRGPLGI
jgi:membrane-associated HD superfamily phosphohydrolase